MLFLGAVGLHRPWDLRAYTGDALGLLTGRTRAYGYRMADRFLAHLAPLAELLTDQLARWTARLWRASTEPLTAPPLVYVDGHRKAVYADDPIPRGMIGKTGKVLGCRALVLLHDADGHPLLATTHRGDQHLTIGLPQILARYEQATGCSSFATVVVDRECMSAPWLLDQIAAGRTIRTCLLRTQYRGLESFQDVGPFRPVLVAPDGTILRDVAPAHYRLRGPDPATPVLLEVALLRDHRVRVPLVPLAGTRAAAPDRWDADLPADGPRWWEDGWQASPTPAAPTAPRLIPFVSTAAVDDPILLVQQYTARWPCQENVIKDWLLPLGLDVNHGYRKTRVINTTQRTQQEALERRLDRLRLATTRARSRLATVEGLGAQYAARIASYPQNYAQLHASDELLWRIAGLSADEIAARRQAKAAQVEHRVAKLRQEQHHAETLYQDRRDTLERHCRTQREVLRALADLTGRERRLYELDDRTDQVMTVFKVALANLGMWVRDQYFPPTYARATWQRLVPFFALKGQIILHHDAVTVQLRSFNDRQHNRDLAAICRRVMEQPPRLPDGRRLVFTMEAPDVHI